MATPERVRKYQATIITKTCIECGRAFEQRRSLSGICSDECKAARRRAFRPKTIKACEHCGVEFVAARLARKYCSARCAYDHRERTVRRVTDRVARNAQSLLRYHIKAGNITRPNECEDCGTTSARIEGAHVDYSRPLDVRWLCRSCHVKFDKKNPKGVTRAVPLRQDYTGETATLADETPMSVENPHVTP